MVLLGTSQILGRHDCVLQGHEVKVWPHGSEVRHEEAEHVPGGAFAAEFLCPAAATHVHGRSLCDRARSEDRVTLLP